MTSSVFITCVAIAAGCVMILLGYAVFQSRGRSSQQGVRTVDLCLRWGFASVLIFGGAALAVWSGFRAQSREYSEVLVDDLVQNALEGVVEHRYANPDEVDVIEQWLNAYVRPVPSVRKRRIVRVSADIPRRAVNKISTAEPLSDDERIQLLDWLAFELDLEIEPSIEELIRAAVIDGELDASERKLLAQWLNAAPDYKRTRRRAIRFRRVPEEESWEEAPAPPAAAPEAAPEPPAPPA